MIIRPEDVIIDKSLLEECLEEFSVEEDKQEMFSNLVIERLRKYNDEYMSKFNEIVNNLYESAIKSDARRIGVLLNRLSKVSMKVYKAEFELYKIM